MRKPLKNIINFDGKRDRENNKILHALRYLHARNFLIKKFYILFYEIRSFAAFLL